MNPSSWSCKAMQVKELGHLVLYVRNVERSAAFYRDVLGWKQLKASGSSPLGRLPVAQFSSGRTHHEVLLIEVGENAQPLRGTAHRALSLRAQGRRQRRR